MKTSILPVEFKASKISPDDRRWCLQVRINPDCTRNIFDWIYLKLIYSWDYEYILIREPQNETKDEEDFSFDLAHFGYNNVPSIEFFLDHVKTYGQYKAVMGMICQANMNGETLDFTELANKIETNEQ